MKKFLKKAALYILIIALIGFAIELYLLTIPNEYSYKQEYVEKNGNSIKTLILGHSHAANGLIPGIIGDSVFNASIVGRGTYYNAILAERYLPTLPNLKCVVFSLGYNFVYLGSKYQVTKANLSENKGRTDFSSTYRCMHSKYMNIDYEGDFHFQYWSEFLNSKYNFGERLYKRDFESLCHCDSDGYATMHLKDKAKGWKTEQLPIVIDYDNPDIDKAWNWGISYMKRYAEACRKANVRLVVITFPCYKSYLEQTTERGMKDLYAVVDSMKNTYPEMEYYNFMNDKRFVEDDFYNSSHLSDRGAEKFSTIFRDEVLNKN